MVAVVVEAVGGTGGGRFEKVVGGVVLGCGK